MGTCVGEGHQQETSGSFAPSWPSRLLKPSWPSQALLSLLIFLSLLASGCATSPRATGFQGGIDSGPISDDEFWVSLTGNVGLDPQATESSLLRRAAELTLDHGFTHFVVTGRTRTAGMGFVLRPGVLGPSQQREHSITIRSSIGHPGTDGAIDARALLQSHGPPAEDASTGPRTL